MEITAERANGSDRRTRLKVIERLFLNRVDLNTSGLTKEKGTEFAFSIFSGQAEADRTFINGALSLARQTTNLLARKFLIKNSFFHRFKNLSGVKISIFLYDFKPKRCLSPVIISWQFPSTAVSKT